MIEIEEEHDSFELANSILSPLETLEVLGSFTPDQRLAYLTQELVSQLDNPAKFAEDFILEYAENLNINNSQGRSLVQTPEKNEAPHYDKLQMLLKQLDQNKSSALAKFLLESEAKVLSVEPHDAEQRALALLRFARNVGHLEHIKGLIENFPEKRIEEIKKPNSISVERNFISTFRIVCDLLEKDTSTLCKKAEAAYAVKHHYFSAEELGKDVTRNLQVILANMPEQFVDHAEVREAYLARLERLLKFKYPHTVSNAHINAGIDRYNSSEAKSITLFDCEYFIRTAPAFAAFLPGLVDSSLGYSATTSLTV